MRAIILLGATGLWFVPPGVAGTTPGADGKRHQTQITGDMTAIRKRLGTTRKAILTIPFPGQGGRKTRLPESGGLFFADGEILGPLEKIVERPAEPKQHAATEGLDKTRIDVFLIQTTSERMVTTSCCRQRRYNGRHDALSISGTVP